MSIYTVLWKTKFVKLVLYKNISDFIEESIQNTIYIWKFQNQERRIFLESTAFACSWLWFGYNHQVQLSATFFFFLKQQPGFLPDSVSLTPFSTCPSSTPWFHHHLVVTWERDRGSPLYSTTLNLPDKCFQWSRPAEFLRDVLGQRMSKTNWRQEPLNTTCPRWLGFAPCSECIEQHKKSQLSLSSSGLRTCWITTRHRGRESAVLWVRSLVCINSLPKWLAKFALQVRRAKTVGL